MVLGLKPMGKLITCDNYLGVRQNQGIAWSSDPKPMKKLITCDNYLGVRQNQGIAWSSDSYLWEN